MKVVSKGDALLALNEVKRGNEKFSITGGPDSVCGVTVYFVQVWEGESVDYRDVMFANREGRVSVYDYR
jgi:hypothetical protein